MIMMMMMMMMMDNTNICYRDARGVGPADWQATTAANTLCDYCSLIFFFSIVILSLLLLFLVLVLVLVSVLFLFLFLFLLFIFAVPVINTPTDNSKSIKSS